MSPEQMIPVLQSYIKERKGVDVKIAYPTNIVDTIKMHEAYQFAINWYKENKQSK